MNKHGWMGCALLLSLAAVGCRDNPVTCGIPGETQDCDCSDGRTGGVQFCRNEKWSACECPGEPIDAGPDTGAGTGGMGGTGGVGGTGGESATGGTGGVDGTPDSGAADSGMADSGTTDSGNGGTGGSFPDPYTGPCTMDVDCGPNAVCVKNAGMTKNHCSPTCTAVNTCPAASSGTGVLECSAPSLGAASVCRIGCPLLTLCPTGMLCESLVALGPTYCF